MAASQCVRMVLAYMMLVAESPGTVPDSTIVGSATDDVDTAIRYAVCTPQLLPGHSLHLRTTSKPRDGLFGLQMIAIRMAAAAGDSPAGKVHLAQVAAIAHEEVLHACTRK